MTKKLYWDDAYNKEFDAKVLAIDDNKTVLDQTAFNPRGGGLVGDTGEINGSKVVDTVKGDSESIIHVLEADPNFDHDTIVHGKLDWERRYRIMRMHTAAHMLSAIIHRDEGALITGNQIESDRSRVDFNLQEFNRELVEEFCRKANEFVKKNLPVKTYFMKREEALKIPAIVKLAGAMPPDVEVLRIVEIVGLDIQADGGPHLKNSGEIGEIKLLKTENKGKNNRRLYYTVVDQ